MNRGEIISLISNELLAFRTRPNVNWEDSIVFAGHILNMCAEYYGHRSSKDKEKEAAPSQTATATGQAHKFAPTYKEFETLVETVKRHYETLGEHIGAFDTRLTKLEDSKMDRFNWTVGDDEDDRSDQITEAEKKTEPYIHTNGRRKKSSGKKTRNSK